MTEKMNQNPQERLFQVVLDIPEEGPNWPPVTSERLWAAKTKVKLHLALRNVPFYAKGVAYDDVILVRPDSDRQEIVFEKLVSESGNSTVQVLIKRPDARVLLERILLDFGVTWESTNDGMYIAADVNSQCDYAALRLRLIDAQVSGEIGLREAAISRKHQSQLESFP